jgi:hypothetical protein
MRKRRQPRRRRVQRQPLSRKVVVAKSRANQNSPHPVLLRICQQVLEVYVVHLIRVRTVERVFSSIVIDLLARVVSFSTESIVIIVRAFILTLLYNFQLNKT